MKRTIIMTLLLVILFGCSADQQPNNNTSSQSDIKWDELSYDWIIDKGYRDALGKDLYAISGFSPLTFFHEDDYFSFTFDSEYYTDTYTISGHWQSDTINFEFSPVPITYQLSGKEKTSFLNLKGSITQGVINSECTLETNDGAIYPIALDPTTGNLIDNEENSSTYGNPMKFTSQLWVMCYSYMNNFYARMFRDETLIQLMRQDMESLLAGDQIDNKNMYYYEIPLVYFPTSDMFWEHLSFAYYDGASFALDGQEYDPWFTLEKENPNLIEMSSSIKFSPIKETVEVNKGDECMTIFYMSEPINVNPLPTMDVYETDQGYIVNGPFGQASFKSDLFTDFLEDMFDDEKATKEFLSQISESDVVKAYLSIGVGEAISIETDDIQWIFRQIQSLANSDELEHITPEGVSEVRANFIFRKDGKLCSFCLHSLGPSHAWIRYEGKFTEFECEAVLQEIISKVQINQ